MSLRHGVLPGRDLNPCGDEASRTVVASRRETAPELLFFLANDPARSVRVAVAANLATPAMADRILAQDEDARVRKVLAAKIAAMAPELDGETLDRLRRQTWETLTLLVNDQAECVRATIAEIVAEMPVAPRGLILQLARDLRMSVAEPILRLSPLLSEADLLALVAAPPQPETLAAIARRPALSEVLSDAIAASADDAAIGALLANTSAAIREATLDALVLRAAERSTWHLALVERPRLTAPAARALAGFVAEELLRVLAARTDLGPELAEELHRRLAERLQPPELPAAVGEDGFVRALAHNLVDDCITVLARRTGLKPQGVTRAFQQRNNKALVSLCWQAGLSPQAAARLQASVAGQVLAGGDGWPMSEEEMRWQIDLLRHG
ncbi:DUF2336 domain-containing protein [Roseomonas sp. BN140053]|uniref:DUF2336 domain-containing protein n=1 Tax=Roseomonas sp. BN140053 TaxID=3391898 RepID=UPI0039EAFF18